MKFTCFQKFYQSKKGGKGFFWQRIWKEKIGETPLLRGQLTLQLRSLWGSAKVCFALNKSILHPLFFKDGTWKWWYPSLLHLLFQIFFFRFHLVARLCSFLKWSLLRRHVNFGSLHDPPLHWEKKHPKEMSQSVDEYCSPNVGENMFRSLELK